MPSLLLSVARRHLREFLQASVDSICPPVCPACGVQTTGLHLCPTCRRRLLMREPPVCVRCGVPVFTKDSPCTGDHRRIQGFFMVRSPLSYRGTGGELVRRAKFQADRGALVFLANAMSDALSPWARSEGRRALLVSVPLFPQKRRRRGLDQAALLADAVAGRLSLRVVPGALSRLRDTLPQGDVRVTSRVENVRDAFAVSRRRSVRDRVVVLVDDVRTTGSTARECARVLRAAGAGRIVLLTAVQA